VTRKNETPVFRQRQKVAAAQDLPGIPAGTTGRVLLVNGFAWVRYRVQFDNGVERGMLHGEQLMTAADATARAEAEEVAARREARAVEMAAAREAALAAEAARGPRDEGSAA
jgi:hypothetical protein